MFSTAIVAIAALFATGTSAAPLGIDVGAGVGLGLNVGSVNSCLFRDPLTRLVVNSGLVLDLNANVCLPVSACAQVEVLPLGLLSLPVCKKVKTCPATLSLNDDGLCVCVEGSIFANTSKTSCITKAACTSSNTNIVSGTGVSAICKPKPCADGLTLNADGLCVCADGLVFSGPEKSACIAVDACDTKLNVLQGGVCLPKICLSTQILDLATGLCIDRSLCNPLRNTLTGGVCKAKVCASGQKLNLSTGVCDLVSCAAGLLFNPARTKCISTSACNLFLNNVVDGACMPKPKCSSSGLFRLVDGICACGEGLSLNVLGLCVAVNIGL